MVPRAGDSGDVLAGVISKIGTDDFSAALAHFLRQCAPYDNYLILAYRNEDVPSVLYCEIENPIVYQAFDRGYLTGAYLLDPFYTAHLERIPAGVYRLLDIAPDQFKHTSYFRRYYRETTMIDEVAAFGYTPTGYTITVCLGTDQSSGKSFSGKALSNLLIYEKVITALIEKNWSDLVLDQRAEATSKAPNLDQVIDRLMQKKGIRLTKRQAEVAMQVLQGHSSESIGLNLKISPHTVKVFRKQLYSRCQISSQAELFSLMMPLILGER